MPVLPLDCHLPTQYTTHTITLQQWTNNKTNKSYKQLIYIYIYIYIHISCKCDTNRAGHFTLDAHASIPVACPILYIEDYDGCNCLHVGIKGNPYHLKGSQVASDLLRLKLKTTKAYTMFVPKFEKHPIRRFRTNKNTPFSTKSLILKINMIKYRFVKVRITVSN